MAINLSTGFLGFLCSAKKTATGYVEDFLTGFAGHGWKIWERFKGRYCLEIDDLVVRGTMTVFELIIQKIRAIKGALAITQGSGKIKTLREDSANYYLTLEDEMSFMADDFVRCQRFIPGKGVRGYWVKVASINSRNEVVIPKSEFALVDGIEMIMPPEIGDELVQFGNETNKARQSAIYLHADEGGIPAIDVMFGINSKSFTDCVKTRLGGALPGEPEQYNGLYCENGLIKSVNEAGDTMYIIRPDGSGFLAGGAIKWEKQDGVWNAEFNGIINAIGGVFSGYLRLPFISLENSDAVLTDHGYLLVDNLNIKCGGSQDIILPTDLKYEGGIVSICANQWPPYTKSTYPTYVSTQNGEKIYINDEYFQIPNEDKFVDAIGITTGITRFSAVLGKYNASSEDAIRWMILR